MNEKQELVIRTLSYLEEHLQETLSLQAVSSNLSAVIPPFYLHRSLLLRQKAACGCMIM
ncbi:MAG: hypothetical protein ACLTDX_24710 [[Clostridium] innocuum]